MPTYYDPYRGTESDDPLKPLGSGYYQDLRTGEVRRRNAAGVYSYPDDKISRSYSTRYQRLNQAKQRLNLYDEQTNKFRDRSISEFSESANFGGARAAAGLAQSTNQFAQRRGLGDEFTAALNAEQQGQARQQITQSTLDFTSKLGMLLNAERIGFVKGEFDFMHRLEAMDYAQKLSKEMAEFQARLASDQNLQNLFGDMLQVGGFLIGSSIGGPAGGVAAAGEIGGGFGGGPGYEDPGYQVG